MKLKTSLSLDEAIAAETGELSRIVLEYSKVMKEILDGAKHDPNFSARDWAPLAALVDTANFERIGTFKEIVNWEEYVELLTKWAVRSSWDVKVRRITEQPGCVFLELAEFSSYQGSSDAIYSLSVYEFGEGRKLRHLDVYMQRAQGKKFDGETWNVAGNRT